MAKNKSPAWACRESVQTRPTVALPLPARSSPAQALATYDKERGSTVRPQLCAALAWAVSAGVRPTRLVPGSALGGAGASGGMFR